MGEQDEKQQLAKMEEAMENTTATKTQKVRMRS